MFHMADSHSNERDLHQYSTIIIPVQFMISPYQTSIYVEIPELLLSPRNRKEFV